MILLMVASMVFLVVGIVVGETCGKKGGVIVWVILLERMAVWLGQSIAVLVNIWWGVDGQVGTLNWKLYTDQRFHSLMMAYAFIVEIEMTML